MLYAYGLSDWDFTPKAILHVSQILKMFSLIMHMELDESELALSNFPLNKNR